MGCSLSIQGFWKTKRNGKKLIKAGKIDKKEASG